MIMLKVILFLVVLAIISLSQNVKGDGMIEVFQWKQMDFYDHDHGNGVGGAGSGGGKVTTRRPSNGGGMKSKVPGSIIFPDRRQRRSPDVQTSRDQPVTTNTRGAWSSNGAGNTNAVDNSNSSSYIPYNNVPMGATHFNGRLFVTMPRRRIGIPSTLNYIDMEIDGKNPSPKLHAYPNIETNRLNPNFEPNTKGIVSVYRTTVDACKRLWFIDTGMLEYPDNRMQVQRPSIWVIDLTMDLFIKRFEIPQSVVETGRGLASITIDVDPQRCGEAFAYIPDLVSRLLFVYSFADNRMWTFSHNYFNFDPVGGDLTIAGQTFRWDDGIFSATLGAVQRDGFRPVYFHAMASNNEFVVSSRVLRNESNAERGDHGPDFMPLGSRGNEHQSTMHDYDPRTGIIFYDEIQRNGVGCWNTNKPFSAANHGTVIQDAQRMIYPSDLTIDEDGTIWVMSNTMPLFIYASLDPNVVNFRIWKQNVFEAAKNTICAI